MLRKILFFAAGLSVVTSSYIGLDCRPNSDCLRKGSPESVGLESHPLAELVKNVSAYSQPANYSYYTHNEVHPIEPGAAVAVGRHKTLVSYFAVGKALLYKDADGTKLPKDQQLDATVDTIYDMASLTKLFTTIAVLQQFDSGKLELHEKVARYVPDFAKNGKQDVTLLMLLTHTSGFDADPTPSLCDPAYKTQAQKRKAIVEQKLKNTPGSTYLYSDLNFMNLGIVLETVTGRRLDQLIRSYTSALGMQDTFFNRGNVEGAKFKPYARMAAQEFQIAVLGPTEPQRPQPVRGTVHDENAYCLNGVSGHAGLFSTVGDTAVFCQMILNGGTYGGRRILKPATVDLIFKNFNARFPGDNHGLGFELDQTYWAGPMAGPQTAGHTGFTGTTLAIDRPSDTFFLLFANRVHPSRNWSNNNIVREAVGYWVARSLDRQVDFPSLSG